MRREEFHYSIVHFDAVQTLPPLWLARYLDRMRGKKKNSGGGRAGDAFKLGISENSHGLSEKGGLCCFKSQVLLLPLSNIFYFTSPEKK